MGDEIQAAVDLRIAHHLADVQPHMQHLQHVAGAERVPRVEDVVMTEADVNARFLQLSHPGDAAALRIVIKAPLKMNIDQRVSDEVNPRHLQQAEQPRGVCAVVGVHGGGVAGRHARADTCFIRQRCHRLDKPRLLVVDFIAVDIQRTVILLRQFKSDVQRLYAILAGELEVRDRPHHVGPQP